MRKYLMQMTGLLAALGAMSAPEAAKAATRPDILVPAYFYPGLDGNGNGKDDWVDLADAAKKIGVVAIMNPNSGAGSAINQDYVKAVQKVRANGGKVIGYLATTRGNRPLAALKTEINNYIKWYKVDGFFLDEMPTTFTMGQLTAAQKQTVYKFYESLADYIDGTGRKYTVGNPGNLTELRFLTGTADVLVTLENAVNVQTVISPPPQGVLAYVPAAWQLSRKSSQFGVIQHNVKTVAHMRSVVDAGVNKKFGLFYVTDDVLPNPFDRLPTYWDAFVQKAVATTTK